MSISVLQSLLDNILLYNESVLDIKGSEKFCNNLLDSCKEHVEEVMKNNEYKSFGDIRLDLKEIQKKCEEDYSFSKKVLCLTNPLVVCNLLESYKKLASKVETYVSSNIDNGNSLISKEKDILKDIENFDSSIDEVFSNKDEIQTVSVINGFLKMIDKVEDNFSPDKKSKGGNFFNIVIGCSESMDIDEDIIIEYRKFKENNTSLIEHDDDIGVIHHHLTSSRSVIVKFNTVTSKLFGKSFGEIVSHVKSMKK